MTQLQRLNEQKRSAKHQMFLTRPLRGYLGNRYNYWEGEWNKIKDKIRELRNGHGYILVAE